jgi:4a-hydroxytetrahydrobiopterin dehydratase
MTQFVKWNPPCFLLRPMLFLTHSVSTLAKKSCEPCRGDVPPLKEDASQKLLSQLDAGWQIIDNHHLEKEYSFENFRQALDFTNRVGELAEIEGHHPDIYLAWGKVKLTVYTHKIDGLAENDFVIAAKADQVLSK